MSMTTLLILGLAAVALSVVVVRLLNRSWDTTITVDPAVHSIGATLSEDQRDEIQALLDDGNKIAAIKRVRELTSMDLKQAKDYVDAFETGEQPPPFVPIAPASGDLAEVHALAQAGNTIEAIKLYRELTGVGLKEAKDYVDGLETGAQSPPLVPAAPASGDLDEVHALAQAGNTIEAIKLYRELTGVDLKEAKDYVDGL